MSLAIVLLSLPLLLLLGVLLTLGHSQSWGYELSGALWLLVIILFILMLTNTFGQMR